MVASPLAGDEENHRPRYAAPMAPRGAPVETLFLDAGGVLIEPDWTRIAAILARHGIAVAPGALAAADPAAKRELDRPAVIDATDDRKRAAMYYRTVLARAGARRTEAQEDAATAALVAEHALRNLWSVVPPGVRESLARLRAAGTRLVVVSNANGKIREHFEGIDFASPFDHVIDSGVLGIEKPDPGIFREALRVSGARPETTLHIGDFYEIDVVGARAAGLRAVLVDPAGLHADRDCERAPSLPAFVDALLAGR
jgi:putative hydrolase of the HAD superfamily